MTAKKSEQALVRVDDDARLGPAMQALTPLMRAFVTYYVENGCEVAVDAAEAAGYSAKTRHSLAVQAHKLLQDIRVQAAIRDETLRCFATDGPVMRRILREVALNKTTAPRDKINSAKELLNRGGFHGITERHVQVNFQTDADKDREILALAAELGLDDKAKRALLGKAIDVPFEEITDPPKRKAKVKPAEEKLDWSFLDDPAPAPDPQP